MKLTGTWHIQGMDTWDGGYLNMKVQTYNKIGPNKLGNFQYGLVSRQLDGEEGMLPK